MRSINFVARSFVVSTFLLLAITACDERPKQTLVVQRTDSTTAQTLADSAGAIANRTGAAIANAADSVGTRLDSAGRAISNAASNAGDSIKKTAERVGNAMDEKADQVAASVRNSHAEAYNMNPPLIDREPETDMASLKRAIVYPKTAKDQSLEGRVRVRALVGTNGKITRSFVESSTNAVFEEPAQTAVKQARFTPGMHKGKRIARWISVPVTYRLL
jgi:TonB family protein